VAAHLFETGEDSQLSQDTPRVQWVPVDVRNDFDGIDPPCFLVLSLVDFSESTSANSFKYYIIIKRVAII